MRDEKDRIPGVIPLIQQKANGLARRFRLNDADAEDMFQAGLMVLVQRADRYDPARGKFTTFAAVVAVNGMKNWLKTTFRRRARRGLVIPITELDPAPIQYDPQRAAELAEAAQRLEAWIAGAGLNPDEADAARLYFCSGRTKTDIVKITGIPADRQRALYCRAAGELKDLTYTGGAAPKPADPSPEPAPKRPPKSRKRPKNRD